MFDAVGGSGGRWQEMDTKPDSKVHGANMGPTWVLSAPDGLHVGPMNLAIREILRHCITEILHTQRLHKVQGVHIVAAVCNITSTVSVTNEPMKTHQYWQISSANGSLTTFYAESSLA